MNMFSRGFRLAPVLLLLAAGCASLPADSGRGDVSGLLKERGHELPVGGDDQAVRRLLAEVSRNLLTAAGAVRLALVNNPALKAEYAKLGFAAAEVYEAGRLSNPRLSASILLVDEPGLSDKLDFGLTQSFTSLLLLPARSRFAKGEFERVKQSVGARILNLAADAEAAWYDVVGAWQLVTMREAVATAARASADLAQRFFDAGNINRLELAREQAAASQAQLDLLQARAGVTRARSALNRLMGLAAMEDDWKVSDRLPAPLPQEDPLSELLKAADASRLDLAAARQRVSLFADALGVTRRFRYLGEIEVGISGERDTDGSRHLGPGLSLELPIFNQGTGRVARAEAGLHEAEAELRVLEIAISNGVQRAAAEVAVAKARAGQYRESLIPLREAIVARTGEEVNYMLAGQFELLLAKQQEYDAYQGYLEAVRDYWLARVELTREVGVPLPSGAQAAGEMLDAEELTRPKGGGVQMNHEGMQMDDSVDGMGGMDHDMPGMEKPGGMKGKGAAPKNDTAPAMPPPRKGEGRSDMPTGMESHIPKPGGAKPTGKSDPAPTKSDPTDTQQHGDHP